MPPPTSSHPLKQVGHGTSPFRQLLVSTATLLLSQIASATPSLAPYVQATKPIIDNQGRTRVIVDFLDDAHKNYLPDAIDLSNGKSTPHNPQAKKLIDDYEKKINFKKLVFTTWVGNSVTAYLDADQIDKLRKDPKVKLLADDTYEQFSAPPPWYPNWNGAAWGELNDWGRVAVNGKTTGDVTGPLPMVYIIDSGVADHSDLSSVISRINLACNTPDASTRDCSNDLVTNGYAGGPAPGYYSPVGCYAHATHVAGIVGATANNGQTRAGVFAGVPMTSIATGITPGTNAAYTGWRLCSAKDPVTFASTIGVAFDYVYANNLRSTPGARPNVVTMSINTGQVGYSQSGTEQSNRAKLLKTVNPGTTPIYIGYGIYQTYYYPGAVFTQSAGNHFSDTCSNSVFSESAGAIIGSPAFKTSASATSTTIDGILVVGGINSNGDAVTGTAQNGNRFLPSEPLGLANADKASNYGNCVDIWAPAERIYSTWGYGDGVSEATSTLSGPPSVPWYTNNPPYSGQQPSNYVAPQHFSANGGYRGWGWLSGTSMAAPHVAAAAAYVIAKYQLSTPAAAEQKLRDLANQYGSFGKFDLLNNPVRVVNLGP